MSEPATRINFRNHSRGNPDAPITFVEYGDYQCPYCGQAYYVVKELLADLKHELSFVFRNFPLSQIHPRAIPAALAAEAAGLQNRFWEMHDILFENQDALEDEDLLSYAATLGLDIEQFLNDINSDQVAQRIQEDLIGGIHSGVRGTPTFFINGHRHIGSYEYDVLRSALEKELRYSYGQLH